MEETNSDQQLSFAIDAYSKGNLVMAKLIELQLERLNAKHPITEEKLAINASPRPSTTSTSTSFLGSIIPKWLFPTTVTTPNETNNEAEESTTEDYLIDELGVPGDDSILTLLFGCDEPTVEEIESDLEDDEPRTVSTAVQTDDEDDQDTEFFDVVECNRCGHCEALKTGLTTHFIAHINPLTPPSESTSEQHLTESELTMSLEDYLAAHIKEGPSPPSSVVNIEYKFTYDDEKESFEMLGSLDSILPDSIKNDDKFEQFTQAEKFFTSLVHIFQSFDCHIQWNGFHMVFTRSPSIRLKLKTFNFEPFQLIFRTRHLKDVIVTRTEMMLHIQAKHLQDGNKKYFSVFGDRAMSIKVNTPDDRHLVLDFPKYVILPPTATTATATKPDTKPTTTTT